MDEITQGEREKRADDPKYYIDDDEYVNLLYVKDGNDKC